ncbi:sodium-dependent bicarbonate transport family permease [Candidatus Trichorickettsia mobilis]|uniref:sodium-dependent bicarbonate transport family permease n=1 Tax=Candidatus Trichorickettsia mobilis TaxID=1346319 RepID=UPI00292F0CCE|nr:sodium-dependent bicarbonate transport family permease [Candidatus Trichorickettsia mobilis]
MELFTSFTENLLSPPILFFSLGIISGLLKSDLEVPEQISRFFVMYIMMAIGFKGGIAIAETNTINSTVILTILAGMSAGFIQPFIGYYILKLTTKLDDLTAAAVAAHYGSISMITFVTAVNFLGINSIVYSGYIVAVLSLMEAPAIVSGLLIAYKSQPKMTKDNSQSLLKLIQEIVTNGSILLLMGSFFIGWMSGAKSMEKMEGFLVTPFYGILTFFLLDMGLLVSRHLSDLKEFNLKLVIFGIGMPLIGGVIGIALSVLIKLDLGTGFLFTVLISSASYIVVTAAMRTALPQAKAAIYVPMSLAITFPFNITIGIPMYFAVAQKFLD